MVSVSVRYLLYQPMDNIKTWTLRFPAKKSPNMEKVFFDCPIVLQYDVNEKYPLISRKFSGIHSRVIRKSLYRSLAVENEDPQWVFQDTGFALFEGRDSGF